MPRITFVTRSGVEICVDLKVGETLRDAAMANNVAGIYGDCGGACACATCHIYVDPQWTAMTGAASDMEQSMLESAGDPVLPESRLACQIQATAGMDGMVVRVAAE